MDWFRARQQFHADLPSGAQRVVAIGEVLPGNHELVKRDHDAATAAAKAGIDRLSLFEPLDTGDDEEPAPAKRGRSSARGA